MAVIGWGCGFYGPPIYVLSVIERTGWSVTIAGGAVTLHFLAGAVVIPRLPSLHHRFGVGPVAAASALCTALGVYGWAIAAHPWQLLVAACVSGAGWVGTGAVAVNAAIAPWFDKDRPIALARAYNGASIGGFLFAPLWVTLIGKIGFPAAAMAIGVASVSAMVAIARFGLQSGRSTGSFSQPYPAAPGSGVDAAPSWRERRLWTLAGAMALGLFAQIGLLSHFVTLSAPMVGAEAAGLIAGIASLCGMAGRMVSARLLTAGADRREVAAGSYAVQAVGTVVLMTLGTELPWLALGAVLFGLGIGNATSLPPLIAQVDFPSSQVARVVARIVAAAQATYAVAPATLAILLPTSGHVPPTLLDAGRMLTAVLVVQALAIALVLSGARPAPRAR